MILAPLSAMRELSSLLGGITCRLRCLLPFCIFLIVWTDSCSPSLRFKFIVPMLLYCVFPLLSTIFLFLAPCFALLTLIPTLLSLASHIARNLFAFCFFRCSSRAYALDILFMTDFLSSLFYLFCSNPKFGWDMVRRFKLYVAFNLLFWLRFSVLRRLENFWRCDCWLF